MSVIDFADTASGNKTSTLHPDICIIGAGAAGITLAREFLTSKMSVCVLESGGYDLDSKTQMLTEGWTKGNVLPENQWYLSSSRLRYFGGTTNHWDGWCRPLEPLDFRERSWIPESGWPVTRADLDPFYGKASEICGVRPFLPAGHEKDGAPDTADAPPLTFETEDKLETTLFHLPQSPVRFGKAYRKELESSPNIHVILNANVVNINLNRSARAVESVTIATLANQKKFTMRAKVFILATGGIENARLLLLSNDVAKSGVGNLHDLVGRYFMDHLYIPIAGAVVRSPESTLETYRAGTFLKAIQGMGIRAFCMNDRTQESLRLLNTSLFLRKHKPSKNGKRMAIHALELFDRMRKPFAGSWDENASVVGLQVRSEQSPQASSRVTLDTGTDALGLRKSVLLWNITSLEHQSALQTVKLFAEELGAATKGHVKLFTEDPRHWKMEYGAHHMGTTRMSTSPLRGVVNPDCKVHDVVNLFIAGSSVFPTSGFANPTLTIVALALRLSEYLKASFKRGTFS